MSLTKEKIIKNAEKYFETSEKYGFMSEKLQTRLGVEFVGAPASTRTDLHNAYEGGLIEHLLCVTKYAVKLKELVPNGGDIKLESIIKVCLLHQIGKTNLYEVKKSDWHNKNGIMYDFNNELVSMHVGERSAHMAMSHGIELSEDEYQAIVNHDKGEDDKQAKWHSSILGVILRQANELAIIEEKNR